MFMRLLSFTNPFALTKTEKTHFYDLVDKDMDGNEVKMDKFKGEVCIVVNVASF